MKTLLLALCLPLFAHAAPEQTPAAIIGAKSLAQQVVKSRSLSDQIERTHLENIEKTLAGGNNTGQDGKFVYDTAITAIDCDLLEGGLGHTYCSVFFVSRYQESKKIRNRFSLDLDILFNGEVSSVDISE